MNVIQFNHTAQLLTDILLFQQPTDAVLAAYWRGHRQLGKADRRVIAEMVFGVLRHYQKISMLIEQPQQQTRLTVLLAVYFGRHELSESLLVLLNDDERKQWQAWQGRLLALLSDRSLPLPVLSELPEWLVRRLQAAGWLADEIVDWGNAVNQTAPLDVRVNTLKAKRDKVLSQLQQEFDDAVATPYSPVGIRLPSKPALNQHDLFLQGLLEVQDEGSQLLALLLQAKRGEMVVDFCAGAGGKTLAMAAQMANQGRIYAFDVVEKRLANLKPRMQRAGVVNIHVERIVSEQDKRLARLQGKADKVLVDVPCSGLGTLRRNPDLKYRYTDHSLAQLLEQQGRILQAASKLVAKGGRLVYATCSVLPEENEQQIHQFLADYSEFELLNCAEILAAQKIHLDTGQYLQLNSVQHQTDGFFAAVLRRK